MTTTRDTCMTVHFFKNVCMCYWKLGWVIQNLSQQHFEVKEIVPNVYIFGVFKESYPGYFVVDKYTTPYKFN